MVSYKEGGKNRMPAKGETQEHKWQSRLGKRKTNRYDEQRKIKCKKRKMECCTCLAQREARKGQNREGEDFPQGPRSKKAKMRKQNETLTEYE